MDKQTRLKRLEEIIWSKLGFVRDCNDMLWKTPPNVYYYPYEIADLALVIDEAYGVDEEKIVKVIESIGEKQRLEAIRRTEEAGHFGWDTDGWTLENKDLAKAISQVDVLKVGE